MTGAGLENKMESYYEDEPERGSPMLLFEPDYLSISGNGLCVFCDELVGEKFT